MKKFNFSLLAVFALALSVAFVSSCDKTEEEPTYTESDYLGTYYGKHTLSDAFLLEIIKGIDKTSDGSFQDTIEVSSGVSETDNILEFKSTLLKGTTIQADISDVSGGNVVKKTIEFLTLSDSANVDVKNVTVKESSSVRGKNGNTFEVTFNLAGTIVTPSLEQTLSNIPTKGTFTKQ